MTKPPPKRDDRAAKEAAALRENLRKRKAQTKDRGPREGGFRTPKPKAPPDTED